jgi:hypothetical protein
MRRLPVPQTNANMITDLQASNLNPFGEVAVAGGQQIYIHLTVDGVTPNLDGLVAAITTFYGGATKVTNENDRASRGVVRLRVVA